MYKTTLAVFSAFTPQVKQSDSTAFGRSTR